MITLSAKDLCTRSCMQIKMFIEHPECRPVQTNNPNVVKGDQYQHSLARTIPDIIGEEMRGTYQTGGITIMFSNDVLCKNRIIEIKYVDYSRPVEDWYLKSSLAQCAVYKALLDESGGQLVTASFHVNEGHEKISAKVPRGIKYVLYFGEKKYLVEVTNSRAIADFIARKARACLDWQAAKEFDVANKHREYEILSQYFTVREI